MKCPKCGYNSFEFLDNCKKCNSSLSAFKQSVGLRPIVLPLGGSIASAAVIASVAADQVGTTPTMPENSGDDIFQWDMSSAAPESSAGTSGIDDFDLNLDAVPAPATPLSSDPFSLDDDLFNAPSPQPEQPAKVGSFDEFSLDLPDGRSAEIFPDEDLTTPQSQGLPLQGKPDGNSFGEFSFDLPDENMKADIPAREEKGAQEPSRLFAMESDATGFGEFSFDDSPDSDTPETTGHIMTTNPDNLQPATPFSFDGFGDLDEADLTGAAHTPPAVEAGEFELDSFLAMEETSAPAKDGGKPHSAAAAKLSGGEFDSIFGELEGTGSKG